MPLDKNKDPRFHFIDEMLQHESLTHAELLEKVNNKLRDKGYAGISGRTLSNDLKEIENCLGPDKIEKVRDGKAIRISYEDRRTSFFEMIDNETFISLQRLMDYMKGLESFKELDKLQDYVYHICEKYGLDENSRFISFDETGRLENSRIINKNIDALYMMIRRKQVALIKMETFNKNGEDAFKEYYIHPYHLKEYQNRWYLIGYCEEDNRKEKTVLAIDRMKRVVEHEEIEYREPDGNINYSTIFNDRIGIGDGPIVNLKIKVRSALRYKYLISKSLHTSQTEGEMVDGCHVLEYQIVNNKELHQKLLSFGDEIEVLEPLKLRNSIVAELEKAHDVYKND